MLFMSRLELFLKDQEVGMTFAFVSLLKERHKKNESGHLPSILGSLVINLGNLVLHDLLSTIDKWRYLIFKE